MIIKLARAAAVAAALWAGSAGAQPGPPGPGPVPDPWIVNGSTLSYNKGGVTMPSSVTGGDKGVGTINVQNGYYEAGVRVHGVTSVDAPLVLSSGVISLTIDSNFAVSASALALAPVASGSLLANAGAGSAEPTGVTPSAWLSRWCSPSADQTVYSTAPSTWGCIGMFGTAHTWSGQQTFVAPILGAATGTSLALGGATLGGNALAVTGTSAFSGQITSTLATGTAPFSVASTTMVANLYAARAALADTVTTNANLTGDVTSVGNATTLANIPSNVPMAGSLLASNIAAPSTPAAGKTSIYVDSTQKVLSAKNDAGTVSITVVPSTAVSNQFVTGITSAGAVTRAQPAFTDISGTIASAQLPNATAAAKGAVQGDGSTITLTAGVISCTTATGAQIGCARPDGTTITISGGVLTAVGSVATSVAVGTTTITSGTSGRVLYDNAGVLGELAVTGSGNAVLATNPTIAGATVSGTANFTGTFQAAGNTMTFPGSAATLAALDVASQTVSGGANVTSRSISTGSFTVDCGQRPLQYITGSTSAWTITAPASDGSCIIFLTNAGASAVVPSFSGFSVSGNTGAALTTTASQKFSIFIWRVNGTAGYNVVAHQ